MKKLLSLLFLLMAGNVFCQNTDLRSISAYMEITDNNIGFGQTININTSLNGHIVLELSDTSGISSIHVKLGTTAGSNNLFSKAFDYNTPGTYPDGTSFRREGYIIYLAIGNYTGVNKYFAEAKLETTGGAFTSPISFNN